jgi:hypothetical protein
LSNADQWAKPVWQPYKKHLPPNQRKKLWAQVVRETREPGHKGYYHPDFLGNIENLETSALERGHSLYEEGPVRYFWVEFVETIGASRGEETTLVLVEWHRNGYFHGHPVTWEELKRKGANDEDRDV